uniref:Sec1-like protein n=1 Tax=Spongospora subterranea TaxID=70186 RepID=A0A0H5R6U1_9EUKA|eukprot:CRZ09840.1 hypothetical protein [Spongospora subterranea]
MTDLKAVLANKILAVIQESRERPTDYLVCVCDDYTTKIMSSCLRVHTINDAGVGAVVNIKFPRESLPSTPVIYLIHPTLENWGILLSDFKTNPKYGYVHLYTTATVGPELMKMLEGSPLLPRLKTFKEVNIDFLAIESRVFSFGRPGVIPSLYFKSVSTAVRSDELRRTADQLSSLCVTLNEYPYIRYVAANPVTSEIARLVDKSLENALRNLKNWKFNPNRGTLLILDRSVDCVAPLMHEYTYQAIINDILPVSGEICKLKSVNAKEERKDDMKNADADAFVLSEDDSLWKDLRHKHIGEALPTVKDMFNQFRTKNAAANLDKDASLKELLKAAKHANSFKAEMQRFTKHMSILENVFDHFDKMGLKKLGELEQDIVTGVTEEGRKTNKNDLMNSLSAIIQDPAVSSTDKLRLIMIYIIAQDGIKEATRKTLFNTAKLNDRNLDAVQNLSHLGITLQTNRRNSNNPLSSATIKKNAALAQASKLTLMRFVPLLAELLDGIVTGNLDRNTYPYLKEPPEAEQGSRGASAAKSARAKPASGAAKASKWRNKGADGNFDGDSSNNVPAAMKQIVFIAGGVTFSEMRRVYEIANTTGVEFLVGSTSTITPSQFLDDMSSAHSAVADIEINLE